MPAMNQPIRTTFLIAFGLLLAVIFPLLGLMAACLIAGMALHALLCNTHGRRKAVDRLEPPPSKQHRICRSRSCDWK